MRNKDLKQYPKDLFILFLQRDLKNKQNPLPFVTSYKISKIYNSLKHYLKCWKSMNKLYMKKTIGKKKHRCYLVMRNSLVILD